ncbi:hypothetical protein [Cohnella yongneupensis]|uniref:Polymerase beta nucleotidyltransferase domain-containing protein n=1 Tax=Cohnella yongneupensis TaxID=425006 RepID=A0ABW0QTR8_9BACL
MPTLLHVYNNRSSLMRRSAEYGIQSLRLYGSALYEKGNAKSSIDLIAIFDPTVEGSIPSNSFIEWELKNVLGRDRDISIVDSRQTTAEQLILSSVDIMNIDPNCIYSKE